MNGGGSGRGGTATGPEDRFVELFTRVFGVEKAGLLAPEYPVRDIHGRERFIDFALKTAARKIAFEVDGPTHYSGALWAYEDDLLRQNSLVHEDWRVFRWTDRQLFEESEQVAEQLALFLAAVPGLLEMDDFLPRQAGASSALRLRPHQQAALDWLEQVRSEGKTIALLEHATGAGKTWTAISDARRLGPRVLYLAHRRDLVNQTLRAFRRLWPEVSHGKVLGGAWQPDRDVVCASVQALGNRLGEVPPEAFRYLIVDEAHHAAADSFRQVLGHFTPTFTLGLTATPERPDGKPVLEIFRDAAHRLTLEEAIRRGELVPIRCVRVKTNVDLSHVRFNQVQYHRQDLETRVVVPERNRLIVRTYLDHVSGRKGVTFCVNVGHAEEMARLFAEQGIPARAVSGAMGAADRSETLARFARGELRMLCACDILNEGWDCPDVEVLLMARPTLSRIVYMQQLGRGTRKAPGKESLLVFDFVDNPGRYNASWSLHRVTGTSRYRKGALVLAPESRLAEEQALFDLGEAPPTVLNLGVWVDRYEEIDLFDWQSMVKDMVALPDLEVELAVAEGYLRRKVERGELEPDHTLPIGSRKYHYFAKGRVEEVRARYGLERVTAANIRDHFLAFCEDMDMSASYKPVLLRCLLDTADDSGSVELDALVRAFRGFYEARARSGLPVERPQMVMARVGELTDGEVQRTMLGMPFRKFAQRGYLRYARDVSRVRFDQRLWRRLSREDREPLRQIAARHIETYYARLMS